MTMNRAPTPASARAESDPHGYSGPHRTHKALARRLGRTSYYLTQQQYERLLARKDNAHIAALLAALEVCYSEKDAAGLMVAVIELILDDTTQRTIDAATLTLAENHDTIKQLRGVIDAAYAALCGVGFGVGWESRVLNAKDILRAAGATTAAPLPRPATIIVKNDEDGAALYLQWPDAADRQRWIDMIEGLAKGG